MKLSALNRCFSILFGSGLPSNALHEFQIFRHADLKVEGESKEVSITGIHYSGNGELFFTDSNNNAIKRVNVHTKEVTIVSSSSDDEWTIYNIFEYNDLRGKIQVLLDGKKGGGGRLRLADLQGSIYEKEHSFEFGETAGVSNFEFII